MQHQDLIAIDVHTHAEVSCRQPVDEVWQEYENAASKYFKAGKRPTIAETVAYYRERKIGLVMFTVDSEHEMGNKRIPNEEVIDAARENSDIMVAFASIDPHKGKLGVREVWFYERGSLRFFALRREADDDVYREIPRSEFLPQLPVDLLLACMREPDQTSALRALRAAVSAT